MDWILIQQISTGILTLTNIALSLTIHFGYKSLYLQKAQELEQTIIKYEQMLGAKKE